MSRNPERCEALATRRLSAGFPLSSAGENRRQVGKQVIALEAMLWCEGLRSCLTSECSKWRKDSQVDIHVATSICRVMSRPSPRLCSSLPARVHHDNPNIRVFNGSGGRYRPVTSATHQFATCCETGCSEPVADRKHSLRPRPKRLRHTAPIDPSAQATETVGIQ